MQATEANERDIVPYVPEQTLEVFRNSLSLSCPGDEKHRNYIPSESQLLG